MAITGCEKWYIGFPSSSWGLFFIQNIETKLYEVIRFRPPLGAYYFIMMIDVIVTYQPAMFPSPSWGLFFYICLARASMCLTAIGFRPLLGAYFFIMMIDVIVTSQPAMFPSPTWGLVFIQQKR